MVDINNKEPMNEAEAAFKMFEIIEQYIKENRDKEGVEQDGIVRLIGEIECLNQWLKNQIYRLRYDPNHEI